MHDPQLVAQFGEPEAHLIQVGCKCAPWRRFGAWPHYTPESLSKTLEEAFDFENRMKARNYSPSGGFSIEKTENADSVIISRGLEALLGTHDTTITKISVPRLNSPTTYYVYCDILDPEQTLYNDKPSFLLAQIDKRGRPYEKVTYRQGDREGLSVIGHECKSSPYIHAMTDRLPSTSYLVLQVIFMYCKKIFHFVRKTTPRLEWL